MQHDVITSQILSRESHHLTKAFPTVRVRVSTVDPLLVQFWFWKPLLFAIGLRFGAVVAVCPLFYDSCCLRGVASFVRQHVAPRGPRQTGGQ